MLSGRQCDEGEGRLMRVSTRKLLDKSFSAMGYFSVIIMGAALLVILGPICVRGIGAFCFRATIEHRRMIRDKFDRGDGMALDKELEEARKARAPVFAMLKAYETELSDVPARKRRELRSALEDLKGAVRHLLGPLPGEPIPVMPRNQYGTTRWDQSLNAMHELLYTIEWDYSDPAKMGVKTFVPRVESFTSSSIEPLFKYVEDNIEAILIPQRTFYWRFLTDKSLDAHFYGGIWPELLGTLYLSLGAMLFAVPIGVLAAIYLCEYALETRFVGLLRTCISTLAGVPSIVFGLFGLAFFINTAGVSSSKSVLAGSLTLALLILPTVIRASEEAIKAVPHAYKEAALSLGAGKWHAVRSVILPSALPGIITGTIISMGRAAGETAPIIFTAAVSVGRPLKLWETLTQPTPALSWNVYNLCTEHEAVDQLRHVQFGMVFSLVALVLILNLGAIIMRARISKKLRGAS